MKVSAMLYRRALFLLLLAGCKPFSKPAELKEHWSQKNNPENFGLTDWDWEYSYENLPFSGRSAKDPWSTTHWPNAKGGPSYRWNAKSKSNRSRIFYSLLDNKNLTYFKHADLTHLSPMEKLDLAMGQYNFPLTKSERKRTRVMDMQSGREIPFWHGICHSVAPASVHFNKPGPFEYTNKDGLKVPFGAADMEGILTYYMLKSSYTNHFVSLRCKTDDTELKAQVEQGKINYEQFQRRMNSAHCKGVNAGAFHVVLSNLIGLRNEAFFADMVRGREIWNFPIFAYESEILEDRYSNFSRGASTRTVKEIKIQTHIYYAGASGLKWSGKHKKNPYKRRTYIYWLEVDENEKIIGGSWLTYDRPNFLWRKDKVKFRDNLSIIEKLYAKSKVSGAKIPAIPLGSARRIRLASDARQGSSTARGASLDHYVRGLDINVDHSWRKDIMTVTGTKASSRVSLEFKLYRNNEVRQKGKVSSSKNKFKVRFKLNRDYKYKLMVTVKDKARGTQSTHHVAEY